MMLTHSTWDTERIKKIMRSAYKVNYNVIDIISVPLNFWNRPSAMDAVFC